jgi:hypothetical protein
MRAVDMSCNTIIKAGIQWPFPAATPNSKQMIPMLERNEALVTWLQPHDGKVTDQFPVIRICDQYYTLSLRQMKALWKHVKLRKNFVNRETIPHIGTKLRIPEVLLMEKMRTQQRFNVSEWARVLFSLYISSQSAQVMRESAYGRSHKTIVRKRIDEVLHQHILMAVNPPEGITYFTVQEDESLLSIVEQLRRDCPRWCKDKTRLLIKLDALLG